MSEAATTAAQPDAQPSPEPEEQGHPKRWAILAVLALALLTVVIDNTVLNVAIPTLTKDLHATTADSQWFINAYSLVQAGLLLTAGAMADRYGRKRALLTGLAVFGVGSGAAALAHSPGALIGARAFMAIGGSLLYATVLAVLVQVFPAKDRPKAIGIWAGVNALAFVGGPLLGGFLLEHYWWGAIFLVNLPVAAIGLAAVAWMVPESKDPRGDRPDLLGALLSTIGVAALVYAVISGPSAGWGSAKVLISFAVAVAGLGSFVIWERRIDNPMLDMAFFRNRAFTGAVSGSILVAFGMGGSLFLLTQHMQFLLGYTPLQAGLRIAPLALSLLVVNFTGLGALLFKKVGTSISIAGGMIVMAAGLAAIARFSNDGYGGTLAGLILMGIGMGLATPAMATAIMSAIPPEKAGVGSAINGTLNELGNSLGVAVLGALLTAWFAGRLPHGVPHAAANSLPEAQQAAGPSLLGQVQHAFGDALGNSQYIGAAAVLAGGLVAAYLLRRSRVDAGNGAEAQGE
ncbi:MFS transporter [Mangrovactinospora gilvigrisea]|uniref:MFS transporter n=1 Tax=Mangrovactinospora gilvigrisea TaxID=1428644 RepID=A0A1J7BGH1_9ACTN|nr:MFS transporter [Mangrovactinospora gilvigrisea]OIV37779.1 MFS transporter [Mangrovactinospora gilvigrisea]